MTAESSEASARRYWIAGRALGLRLSGMDPIQASKQAMFEDQQDPWTPLSEPNPQAEGDWP